MTVSRLLVAVLLLSAPLAGCLDSGESLEATDTGPQAGSNGSQQANETAQNGSSQADGDGNASGSSNGTQNASTGDQTPPEPPSVELGPQTRTLVALVDSGINPYHEAFRRDGPAQAPSEAIDGYPANATPVELSLGASSFDEALASDEEAWSSIDQRQLVSFPGTRVVGAISLGTPSSSDEDPLVLDPNGHGTATAHMVAQAGPDVDIVMVQVPGGGDLEEGIAWAAQQPWIDAISLSWGAIANAPVEQVSHELGAETPATWTQQARRDGKLVTVASGNEPTSATTDDVSGPPWVIAVGGASSAEHGDPVIDSKHVDVVSEFYVEGADEDSLNSTSLRAGTSFGAPIVAGTLAQAVHEVRKSLDHTAGLEQASLATGEAEGALADGRLTADEVRGAMNRSAEYWDTADYDPTQALGTSPTAGPAPWVQMGWGFVNGTQARDIAADLLGDETLDPKPGPAQAYQQTVLDLRKAQWSG